MALNEEFETQGAFLFRWRSFLPLIILPFALVAAYQSGFADGRATTLGRGWDLFCVVVAFLGLGIRAVTIGFVPAGTSGRNTTSQRANVLNTSGIYSTMRHPLYVGNFVMFLGLLLFIKSGWLVLIATLAYVLYYERIAYTEEAFLTRKFGAEYTEWSSRTPILPNLRLWSAPSMKFSVRNVLRREYNGFYILIIAFYLLEWIDRALFYMRQTGSLTMMQAPGYIWNCFFVSGTLIFLTLRTLKKHTHLLDVEGR